MANSSHRMVIPEALRDAYRAALAADWTVTRRGSGHLMWRPPDGHVVFTPASPRGGKRSVDNSLSKLRRAGLVMNKARSGPGGG